MCSSSLGYFEYARYSDNFTTANQILKLNHTSLVLNSNHTEKDLLRRTLEHYPDLLFYVSKINMNEGYSLIKVSGLMVAFAT